MERSSVAESNAEFGLARGPVWSRVGVRFLSQSRLLKPTSTVIAEHDKHSDLSERYGALQRSRRLQQGDAVLSFYTLT